jgi:hypothetical protein
LCRSWLCLLLLILGLVVGGAFLISHIRDDAVQA